MAAVLMLVLLPMAPYYGPHRDELYFVAAGRHLAWGYPDQPALTPALARLADLVSSSNLLVLRLFPALAVAGVVLLSAQAARLLGGARGAQVLTAVTVGFSAIVVGLGHLLSTATLDLLFWTAILVVVGQALVDDRPRLWLLAGVIAGIGLNNKHSVVFCLLGILAGVSLTRATRPVLRTPWPYLGGLVALLLWIPNLVWQAQHDWPVFALASDIADEYGGLGGRVLLVLEILLVFSPLIAVVWILGIVELLRRSAWEPLRPWAIAFLVVLGLFVVTGGKGYYLAGLVPVLIAAGCTRLAERPGRRSADPHRTRRLVSTGAVLVASAVVAYPAVLPVLSATTFTHSPWVSLNDDQLDTIGWPEYTGQIGSVVRSLTPEERRTAVAFTGNYGEAGAMSWYRVQIPVYSGHNGYRAWGPPPADATPVVVVMESSPKEWFSGCDLQLRLHNSEGADNEEVGAGVWVCRKPRGSWSTAWGELVHYDA